MTTKQILSAIMDTKNTVESFAARLGGIRYDLIGSVPSEKDSPTTSARPPLAADDCSFADGVEYLYGDINKAMNTISTELDVLRAAIDHKQSRLEPANERPTNAVGRSY